MQTDKISKGHAPITSLHVRLTDLNIDYLLTHLPLESKLMHELHKGLYLCNASEEHLKSAEVWLLNRT